MAAPVFDIAHALKGANVTLIQDSTLSVGSGTNRALVASIQSHDSNTVNRQISTSVWGAQFLIHQAGCDADAGAGTSPRTEIWIVKNPSSGANTLEVDALGQINFLGCTGVAVTGANQSNTADATAALSGNSNSAAQSITPVTTTPMFISSLCTEAIPTAPGGNWTNDSAQQGQSFQNTSTDHDNVETTTTTLTYSLSFGAPWCLSIVSIREPVVVVPPFTIRKTALRPRPFAPGIAR